MKKLTKSLHALAGMTLLAGMAGGAFAATATEAGAKAEMAAAQLGPRPFFLIDAMQDSPLKARLSACKDQSFPRSDLSIGHRGAPLQFPEHTRESYVAAARMGAGIVECDVTFTKDRELVCRHSQSDLHTTTNILAVPELAEKCTVAPDYSSDTPFKDVECRTSDVTLDEFLSLKGKMDAGNKEAKTLEEYMNSTAAYRTDLYAGNGTLMSHRQSIELFQQLGVKMTPELKGAAVQMPFQGDYSQHDYAQQMINDYKEMGVDPADVFPQSFNLEDVKYWLANEPAFGAQAVYLDDRYDIEGFDYSNPATWSPSMGELQEMGVRIIAPPLWMLVTAENGKIVPSVYARAAKAAGLDIITWSLERSGPLNGGGGWYYQSINNITTNDGNTFDLLDVLVQDVGVIGVFSDWPATVTYYAGCSG
ncbi:glycerophosphodiester phosphodiesterase family protein [Marinobacterium sedimentorum]|uniref:glycerophosphodiester phosphodiesterase family protein n=1 Tax=Marinobacterium sedimentorum TaxID=2927804 RepID=UPI0020C60AAA|nr:glycerophosphodiester phosphodiesterase family protein [Marinobacterium sedimentorum]MCP8688387.1 glycerophosphodiester phosphodiesterase [Marinobacterium sedimentorum]